MDKKGLEKKQKAETKQQKLSTTASLKVSLLKQKHIAKRRATKDPESVEIGGVSAIGVSETFSRSGHILKLS
jgi:hypothetical protein